MNCYRCQSTEELSAKKIDRHGNITFICKPCRKEQYVARKPSQYRKVAGVSRDWIAKAKERNTNLSDKYRDEAFMRSKGLL